MHIFGGIDRPALPQKKVFRGCERIMENTHECDTDACIVTTMWWIIRSHLVGSPWAIGFDIYCLALQYSILCCCDTIAINLLSSIIESKASSIRSWQSRDQPRSSFWLSLRHSSQSNMRQASSLMHGLPALLVRKYRNVELGFNSK